MHCMHLIPFQSRRTLYGGQMSSTKETPGEYDKPDSDFFMLKYMHWPDTLWYILGTCLVVTLTGYTYSKKQLEKKHGGKLV